MAAMVLPELFAQQTPFFIHNTKPLLSKHKHVINWRKSPSILEFGFADGSNSKNCLQPIIPPDYKEFIGADVSKPMVDYARKHVALPRSNFCQLDIATKSVPNELKDRFDHIFSFFTIHMIKSPRLAFQNIHRMLKKGGQTFHILYERIPADAVFQKLSQHPRWGKCNQELMISPYFEKENPRHHYEKDLKEAGFPEFYFQEHRNLTYTFPNEKSLKDLFISINATLPYVPESEVEEYKKDYIDIVRQRMKRAAEEKVIPNDLTAKYTLFVISAHKQ
uniref:Juvenile hormone acid O-methyltransferase-like n=1 Tax=Diabrotica virgifera virgifera TaxID=50390 RepID=A0A6P7GFB0_DIAVI